MADTWIKSVLLVFVLFVMIAHITDALTSAEHTELGTQISWIKSMKSLRTGVKDCIKLSGKSIWNCFKSTTLRLFDERMSASVIPLWDGIRFVDVGSMNQSKQEAAKDDIFDERKDMQHQTWFDRLAMRLAVTLKTHILEINLKELTDSYMRAVERHDRAQKLLNGEQNGTARLRRHRYNMIITMMFGVTALGAVLVPMGFQILSVISGKALLLAKMALLLASINGLKRVANSGVHYGLYHVPGENYGGGYYDRGDVHHPRNVPGITLAQPVEIGI